MKKRAINLAWITASDLEKTKKFFTEIIGLELTKDNKEFGWAEVQGDSGMILGIGKANEQEPIQPGNNAIPTITVEDIVKTKTAFEAKGVQFLGDILEVPGHVKLATFTDPDSNIFQLVEYLQS